MRPFPAKRVDVVHVSDDLTRTFREVLARQPYEMPACPYAPMHVGHSGFDISTKLELVPALGDLDGAKLARPVVDILEQMAVDGPKVLQVDVTIRNSFTRTLCDKLALDAVELIRFADSLLVPKNSGSRIDVGIGAHSSACKAAAFRTRSRI